MNQYIQVSAARGIPNTVRRGVMCLIVVLSALSADAATIRVMTFNLWHGGQAGGEPLEQSAAVIRAANADVVGLQETHGQGRTGNQTEALAELLGWNYHEQPDKTAVLSRFEIVRPIEELGVEVETDAGDRFLVFNVHYYHAPYQPYQLLSIPYHNGRFVQTAADAIEEAQRARGEESDQLAAVIRRHWKGNVPVFVTGDFNEPSHLDWTRKAATAGLVPIHVEWPASRALGEVGFRDAYREAHKDEAAKPGNTWTPTTAPDDPKDRHDRIDFVYAAGPIAVVKAKIVGEAPENADIVVTPYPSDHRAVVAECKIMENPE